MNEYQREQREALRGVRRVLEAMPPAESADLHRAVEPYLAFRRDTADFLGRRFADPCGRRCYQSGTSACCAKDSIIVFFADAAVNALVSPPDRLDALERVLSAPNPSGKCVFLAPGGCRWTIKPIVCEMFLCDAAKARVFAETPEAAAEWEALEARRKSFTWPDRPVLFDDLERRFLEKGLRSSLMHLNFSPGMLRLKRRWSPMEPQRI